MDKAAAAGGRGTRARGVGAREAFAMLGLGLLWASEEMLSLCVDAAVGLPGPDVGAMLYVVYLPAYCIFGLLLSLSSRMCAWLAKRDARYVVGLSGVSGIFVIVLFHDLVGIVVGTALYCFGAVFLNCLWFVVISKVSALRARGVIATAAAVTAAMTLTWTFSTTYVIAMVALLFLVSIASLVCAQTVWADEDDNSAMRPHAWRAHGAVIVGAAIFMMAFGFVQYVAYYGMQPTGPFREVISHTCSFVLLVVVLFVLHDTEHTFAIKLSVTLMLLAFVLVLASDRLMVASIALAAGAENLFELVVLLALAELARYAKLDARRVYGWYAVLLGGAQFAGCLVAMADVTMSPTGSYVGAGLLFVMALIVTAVWLLDERRVTAFFWGDAAAHVEYTGALAGHSAVGNTEGGHVEDERAAVGHAATGDTRAEHAAAGRAATPGVGLGSAASTVAANGQSEAVYVDGANVVLNQDARRGEHAEDDHVEDAFDRNMLEIAETYKLTPRETDVMMLFGKGRSSTFIAEQFCVSTNTVRSHIHHIYGKCNIHSRQELITLVESWDKPNMRAGAGTDID
jgi:DNA-binding CsgD family transcriptional regulator